MIETTIRIDDGDSMRVVAKTMFDEEFIVSIECQGGMIYMPRDYAVALAGVLLKVANY